MKYYHITPRRLSLHSLLLPLAAFLLLCAACKREASFRIEGDVKGGEGITMMVERSAPNGQWIVVDSVSTVKDGRFGIDVPASGSPDIYRLNYDGRYIYFPVDSTEHLQLTTTAGSFGTSYALKGSDAARAMAAFDHDLLRLDMNDAAAVGEFKKRVFNKYIRDGRGSLMSYYVLTKVVGQKALFDVNNPDDAKYISAVGTSFKQFNPDDPRAALVEQMAITAQRNRNKALGRKSVLQAEELKVIEIDLPGIDGKNVALSKVMKPGKPTIVAFTSVADPENPKVLLALREIAESHGATVYNVNVDGDRFAWKNSASNLPWTSVYASTTTDGNTFVSYNVGAVPVFFVYDGGGELKTRAAGIDALRKAF